MRIASSRDPHQALWSFIKGIHCFPLGPVVDLEDWRNGDAVLCNPPAATRGTVVLRTGVPRLVEEARLRDGEAVRAEAVGGSGFSGGDQYGGQRRRCEKEREEKRAGSGVRACARDSSLRGAVCAP